MLMSLRTQVVLRNAGADWEAIRSWTLQRVSEEVWD